MIDVECRTENTPEWFFVRAPGTRLQLFHVPSRPPLGQENAADCVCKGAVGN